MAHGHVVKTKRMMTDERVTALPFLPDDSHQPKQNWADSGTTEATKPSPCPQWSPCTVYLFYIHLTKDFLKQISEAALRRAHFRVSIYEGGRYGQICAHRQCFLTRRSDFRASASKRRDRRAASSPPRGSSSRRFSSSSANSPATPSSPSTPPPSYAWTAAQAATQIAPETSSGTCLTNIQGEPSPLRPGLG